MIIINWKKRSVCMVIGRENEGLETDCGGIGGYSG
jgi:hypothetical protein